MKPRRSRPGPLVVLVLCLALAGCTGAFSKALQRGDRYMQAGMWDQAASAYERAAQLEPNNASAKVKLREARRKQAGQRMAQAQTMAARSDFGSALELSARAVSLDPDNLEHQRQLNLIVHAATRYAAESASRGELQQALAIANRVLEIAPQHVAAHTIARQVQQRLADDRFARADVYLSRGLRGNAIVELAACLDHVPSYPNARERLNQNYAALRRELTLRVGLASGTAQEATSFSDLLRAGDLVAAFDPAFPVEVTDTPTPASDLVLSGTAVRMTFDRDHRLLTRSCEYVCGTDHRPNPEHARAEREVADAERRMAAEEEDSARLEGQLDRYQREVDRAERRVTRAESDLDRARQNVASCRQRHEPGEKGACRSERNRLESEQRELERARHRLKGPRRQLRRGREQFARARARVHDARRARNDALERMRSTPRMVEVHRTCRHDYQVEQHRHAGRLVLDLSMREVSSERRLVSLPAHRLEADRVWETYRAQPGRCPRMGQGPPPVLPSNQELRRELEQALLAQVATHILDYGARRLSEILAKAMSAEAEGRIDDAVEGYVRFMIAGGSRDNQAARAQMDALLQRARGVDGIGIVLQDGAPHASW